MEPGVGVGVGVFVGVGVGPFVGVGVGVFVGVGEIINYELRIRN